MEDSLLEKSNSDLIAEDLAAILKQVVLEIKEIKAGMVLKKDFDPFIGTWRDARISWRIS